MNKVKVTKKESFVVQRYNIVRNVEINGTPVHLDTTFGDTCDYDAVTGQVTLKFRADFEAVEG